MLDDIASVKERHHAAKNVLHDARDYSSSIRMCHTHTLTRVNAPTSEDGAD
jgi:hypothetical protein